MGREKPLLPHSLSEPGLFESAHELWLLSIFRSSGPVRKKGRIRCRAPSQLVSAHDAFAILDLTPVAFLWTPGSILLIPLANSKKLA